MPKINKSKTNKKSAFTLVELSTVLLVIGALIGFVASASYVLDKTKLIVEKVSDLRYNSVVDKDNLALWMDATSEDAFDAIPGNGDPVIQWKDINPKNSSPGIFTVHIGSPTYRTDGINGKPAIEFDGNDGLVMPHSSELALIGDMTFFAVFSVDSVSRPGSVIVSKTLGSSSRPYDFNVYTNFMNFWVGNGVTETRPMFTTNYISQAGAGYIVAFTKKPSEATVHINGILHDTKSWSQTGADAGTPLYIGVRGANNSVYMDGKIGEVIMFNRAVTDKERGEITDYLKEKWDIS